MFGGLFKKNANDSDNNKFNYYEVEGQKITGIKEEPGKGSINDIIELLGFNKTQVYNIHTFSSKKIQAIGVKIFTKTPVFLLAKDTQQKISFSDLNKDLNEIDWGFEYSSHNVEDILQEGINTKSLSFQFLNSVTNLQPEKGSLFHAPQLNLYLSFKDGVLESFASSNWSNASSKWLLEVNKEMYEDIFEEALYFHDNEIEAMEEVNLQCEALQNIPNATQNEFVVLHGKSNGNINFFNLLAVHYNNFNGKKVTIRDFKVVNTGRFIELNSNELECEQFIFQFDDRGFLSIANRK